MALFKHIYNHKDHSDFNFQFVHASSGAYYAKETIGWINENLPFVDKVNNLSNIPQVKGYLDISGMTLAVT